MIEVYGWVGFDWGLFWGGIGNGVFVVMFVGCVVGGGFDVVGVGGNVVVVFMLMGMLGWYVGMVG